MLCIAQTMLSQDVCQSVSLSYAGIVSKQLNISSNFFHRGVPHHIPQQTLWQYWYSDGDLPNGPRGYRMQEVLKNRNFRPISRFISEVIQYGQLISNANRKELERDLPFSFSRAIFSDLEPPQPRFQGHAII